MFKFLKIVSVLLFIGFQTVAQNRESRWVVGASVGVAKFTSEDAKVVGDQFIFQVPTLNVSRYFFNGLTLDAGLSFSVIDRVPGFYSNNVSYVSIDGAVKYDFGTSNDNLVSYVLLGGSLLKTTDKLTSTTNFGAGGTFWLNSSYGVNTQLLYKISPEAYKSMRSHTYFSVGVVYSFKPRTQVLRLWSNNNY